MEEERGERERHHYFVENIKNPVTTRLTEHHNFSEDKVKSLYIKKKSS